MKKAFTFVLLFIAISGYAFSENSFFLIKKSKQSPTLPIVFNLLPGFGIGSYLQGDIQTGNIVLIGDTLSAAMIVGGLLSYNSTHNEGIIEPIVCFSVGGLLYLGMKIFGIIEPIKYNNAKKENIKLMSTGNNIILSYSY